MALKVYNFTDKRNPAVIASVGNAGSNAVQQGNFLFLFDFFSNLITYDLTAGPSDPIQVGSITPPANAVGTLIVGNPGRLYTVSSGFSRISIYDSSDPTSVVLLNSINLNGGVFAVNQPQPIAAAATDNDIVAVYNIPTTPVPPKPPNLLALYDLSVALAPLQLSTTTVFQQAGNPQGFGPALLIDQQIAYLTTLIQEPQRPFNDPDHVPRIDGLKIYDISNAPAPLLMSTTNFPYIAAEGMAKSGNKVYIPLNNQPPPGEADGIPRMLTYDISGAPSLLNTFVLDKLGFGSSDPLSVQGVFVKDGFAYVWYTGITGKPFFEIIDVRVGAVKQGTFQASNFAETIANILVE